MATAGLGPPLLFVVLAWVQTVRDADVRLDRYAQITVGRGDRILGAASAALTDMSARIEPRCTPQTSEALRLEVLGSIYFRQASLSDGGKLLCTSTSVLSSPVTDGRFIPAGNIEISAPGVAGREPAAIVVRGKTAGGPSFSLTINPLEIADPLEQLFEGDQVSVVLADTGGGALARIGLPLDDADAGLRRSASSQRYPIQARAALSQAWLVDEWRRRAPRFGGVGLLVGAALLAALLRRQRQLYSRTVIAHAIEDGEFRVYYQPVSDALSGECLGAEALLRWQHPDLGLLPPAQFLPVAERTGMITGLTIWLMRQIVAELAQILLDNPRFHISINLSAAHLLDPALTAGMRRAFSGIIGLDRVIFEITEHDLLAGRDGAALAALNHMRAIGAGLALDDFGTGYSSFKYLRDLPFDYLKIDKVFIEAIGTESVTAGLVDTIAAMGRQLGLKTVAEGVETQAQLDHIRKLKVDLVQGWLFAKAMPVWEFKSYVEADKRRLARLVPPKTARTA